MAWATQRTLNAIALGLALGAAPGAPRGVSLLQDLSTAA
jgi:hypothetical protein